MDYQTIFKRYELKYLLTENQKHAVLRAMEPYMELDQYGRTTIRNIYFDTDSYRLVRHSIESPAYKEKLRLRSYSQAEPQSTVFVELKKKYRKIVYKRRIAMSEREAMDWLVNGQHCRENSQIAEEINYCLKYYENLKPVVFLSYEREAFFAKDQSGFRVTFDENILCRQENISLEANPYGFPLLPEGMSLMEIKCAGAIPLWMIHALSREQIYKTTFSKYGTAYKTLIYPCIRKEAVGFA